MYMKPISIVLDELNSDEFAVALCADWMAPEGVFEEDAAERFFGMVQQSFAEWFETPTGREIWAEMGHDFCFADLHPEDIEDPVLVGILTRHEIYNFVIQETEFSEQYEEHQSFMEVRCA